MNTRRGFLGSVAALVAALPFVGRGVGVASADSSPLTVPPLPYIEPDMLTPAEVSWLKTPDLPTLRDGEFAYVVHPNLAADLLAERAVAAHTPDALKLHEILALYRDGYIDTPTMRAQVRALFPLNAAKVDDGRAVTGKIETEGILNGNRTDIRAAHALSELADVTANGMPAFVAYDRNRRNRDLA